MYGDTEIIRRRVAALRDQGADISTLADQLVARIERLGWSGRAADAMRERVSERATHLRAAAARHTSAADALAAHAEAVDETAEQITGTEHRVTRLVDDAKARIAQISARNEFGDGLHVDPDPLDETLAAFAPPPHGHRDWLDVELPGLDR